MKTKTLFLIRHGKAEDYSFLKKDYERNLVQKGKERAEIVAKKLKRELVESKSLVISSSANRAIQTAHVFSKHIDYPITSIQQEKEIYEAYYKEILKVINLIDDSIETVLIFGHNPGLSDLTNYLCDSFIDLKTSQVSKIRLPENFNFSELSGGTCHLETVITE